MAEFGPLHHYESGRPQKIDRPQFARIPGPFVVPFTAPSQPPSQPPSQATDQSHDAVEPDAQKQPKMSDFLRIEKTFRFCPACGEQAEDVGRNPFNCHGCNYPFYFNPKCAVVGILADPQGRVLMLRRARDPGKGLLGLPGGFVDPGESLEEALAREFLEETSLVVLSLEYLVSFPNTYEYRGVVTPVADAIFVCQIESFDVLEMDATEVASYEFVHPTDKHLDEMAFESNRKALALYMERPAS